MFRLICYGVVLTTTLTCSCVSPKVTVHKKMATRKSIEQSYTPPAYSGGWEAYEKYIIDNIRYPIKARRQKVQGVVEISFVVRKEGHLTDVQIEQGVSAEIDQEAIRLISNMPDWQPALQNNRAVSVRLLIPIEFKL